MFDMGRSAFRIGPALLAAGVLAWNAALAAESAKPESAVAAPPPALEPAVEAVLRALEKSFVGITTVQTDFTEEKELAVFDKKIVLQGAMALAGVDRLAWHVTAPVRYSLVITDATLRQWDEDSGKVQQLSLAGNPVFNVVIDQVRNWFSGRYLSLTREYDVKVTAEKPLVLEFVPRPNSMPAKAIARVTIVLREDQRYVREIRIEEKSGDKTRMLFSNTVLNEPVPAAAWEVKPGAR